MAVAAYEDELSLEEALQISMALEESERTAKQEIEARRLLYVGSPFASARPPERGTCRHISHVIAWQVSCT